jgi:hypothetical protein
MVNNPAPTEFSEITILPDGRLYVFGLTKPILDLLATVPNRDHRWQQLPRQSPGSADVQAGGKPCNNP